jgi:hypothetical protein
MELVKLEIETEDIILFSNLISEEIVPTYWKQSDDMIVMSTEQFRMRTTSQQLNMVCLQLVDSKLEIDLIGAAGGSGIFNLNLGSEWSFTRKLARKIVRYCDVHGYEVSTRKDKD